MYDPARDEDGNIDSEYIIALKFGCVIVIIVILIIAFLPILMGY